MVSDKGRILLFLSVSAKTGSLSTKRGNLEPGRGDGPIFSSV